MGTGGALGGPAHTGVNFGGNPANLGAAPHDWGFAKKTNLAILRLGRRLFWQAPAGLEFESLLKHDFCYSHPNVLLFHPQVPGGTSNSLIDMDI